MKRPGTKKRGPECECRDMRLDKAIKSGQNPPSGMSPDELLTYRMTRLAYLLDDAPPLPSSQEHLTAYTPSRNIAKKMAGAGSAP